MKTFLRMDSGSATGPSHNFSKRLATPLDLSGKKYEIALTKASLWYSWSNINPTLGNQTMRIYTSVATLTFSDFTIPEGQYSLANINTLLQGYLVTAGLVANDITITGNYNTGYCTVSINQADISLDLSIGSLYYTLGMSQSNITTTTTGTNIVRISNDRNMINIHTNLLSSATQSLFNGNKSNILFSFTQDVPPSSIINLEPFRKSFVPMGDVGIIDTVSVYVQDNTGAVVDLRGEPFTIEMEIREVK